MAGGIGNCGRCREKCRGICQGIFGIVVRIARQAVGETVGEPGFLSVVDSAEGYAVGVVAI